MNSKMYAGNLAALIIGGGMTFKKIDAYKGIEKGDLCSRLFFYENRLTIRTTAISHNNEALSLFIGDIVALVVGLK